PSRNKAWIYIVILAAGLSIALFFVGRFTASRASSTGIEAASKSIAVLPFEISAKKKETRILPKESKTKSWLGWRRSPRAEDVDVSNPITRKTGRKLDFFIIAVLLLVIAALLFRRLHPNVSPFLEKSIAVLPFENLSEEKANAYFADGIQDEILTKLASIGDLKVISRKSTAKYKSKPEDLKTVARELGVATVLEGSVQKAADKVRVNVQLLDARIDTHLWAKSYDRDLKDVLTVESEVAQEIADTLRAKLSPSQSDALATAPTRDTEAYNLFLNGEYEEHQAESILNAEPFDRAQTFYRQALARDQNFALAYAKLAHSELYRHWFIS